MSELKPCPMCGHESPELEENRSLLCNGWQVSCGNRDCVVEINFYPTPDEAEGCNCE